ncbi:hypothetical protein MMC25_006983 [Agyrium rufum]|nr:hypothetical protein [Agyrium rufum]
MDQYIVQSARPADAAGLASAMMSAWYANPHWRNRWEAPNLEQLIGCCTERLPWTLVNGRDRKRHQKVVSAASGEIVAYARWSLPPDLAAKGDVWLEAQVPEPVPQDRKLFEEKSDAAGDSNGEFPGARTDGVIEFKSAPLEAASERIWKGGPYLTLEYLTVAPRHQRKGIAPLLVKAGHAIADEYGVNVHVMASMEGLRLYETHGFQLIETVSTDYSQYGGGPIIRVTPWEVHINDVNFLDEIYAPSSWNREKYSFQTRTFKVSLSIGGTLENNLHRRRREALNPFFSKRSVIALEMLIKQKVTQLCDIVQQHAKDDCPLNLSDIYFAFANEYVVVRSAIRFAEILLTFASVVTHYSFGHDGNLLAAESRASIQRNNISRLLLGIKVNQHAPWLFDALDMILFPIAKHIMPPGALDMVVFSKVKHEPSLESLISI